MSANYLTYWRPETVTAAMAAGYTGNRSASDQFGGVLPGDVLWIVTSRAGRLFLLNRFKVHVRTTQSKAARLLGVKPSELWEATHHVLVKEGDRQPLTELELPVRVVQRLRFHSRTSPTLELVDGKVNPQRLQTLRTLEDSSAALLDKEWERVGTEVSRDTSDPDELRRRAQQVLARQRAQGKKLIRPKGKKVPKRTSAIHHLYERDPKVVAWVLQEAKGKCEACSKPGPFRSAVGDLFLEVHHVRRLARGGSDRPENAVALCPNCHRALHHAVDSDGRSKKLYDRVRRLGRE